MLGLEMLPQLAMQASDAEKGLATVSTAFFFYAVLVTVCFILAAIAAASLWLKLRKIEGNKDEE